MTRAEFAALERRVAGELRALEEKAAARVKRARARHSRADMEADARAAGVDAGGKSAKTRGPSVERDESGAVHSNMLFTPDGPEEGS